MLALSRREVATARAHARKGKENSMEPPVVLDETALGHLVEFAEETQEARLLKFVRGKYWTGNDEVPAGRDFVAHVHQVNHGWVKFDDRKVIEQRVGPVAKGFKPCSRDKLGDTDEAKWERDGNGTPRDPW